MRWSSAGTPWAASAWADWGESARTACGLPINDEAAIASGSEALEGAMKEIAEVAYSAAGSATNGAPEGAASDGSTGSTTDETGKGDDDVIDAEFEEGE